ncbi:MAG: hypothetical protein U1G07_05490 [Verrucomicrobiota bacterium]
MTPGPLRVLPSFALRVTSTPCARFRIRLRAERLSDSPGGRALRPFFLNALGAGWIALLCLVGPFSIEPCRAASFELTILAQTNDIAPGSGAGLGQPDGFFSFTPPNVVPDWQFAAPVAAAGGHVAFQGAVQQRDQAGNLKGIDTGIWAGVGQAGLTMLFRQRLPAPPVNSNFTQYGFVNISELGPVAFSADTTAPLPSAGLWWGDSEERPLAALTLIKRMDSSQARHWQTGPFVGFAVQTTNWVYHTQTGELHPVGYVGMPAEIFGLGITLKTLGAPLALTSEGDYLMQGQTSDGTNRIFVVKNNGTIVPVLAQGQEAPGIPGRQIGVMFASGSQDGAVAILTRLADGDGNLFNDRSALLAGPASALRLLGQSNPGVPWGGTPLIARSNLVFGPSPAGNGFYRVPEEPSEPITFSPLPPKPYPARAVDALIATAFNALGQSVELYGNPASLNSKNPGRDLWLYRPDEGWTNIARAGSNVLISGQTLLVNAIGFVGSLGGGAPIGLADDGTFAFCLNGTHIVTTKTDPCPVLTRHLARQRFGLNAAGQDFFYTALLDNNWHSVSNDCPPVTNWEDAGRTPHPIPPGEASPGRDRVTARHIDDEIPTIVLDRKSVDIASLHAGGLLRLNQQLTLNEPSRLHNLRLEPSRGALTIQAETAITNTLDWRAGIIDGNGPLLVTNLFLTNGGTARLGTTLVMQGNGRFEGGTALALANGRLQLHGGLVVGEGSISNVTAGSLIESSGLVRKEGTGLFQVTAPFHRNEPAARSAPSGIEVRQGRFELLGGAKFFGNHTVTVRPEAALELAGAADFGAAGAVETTTFEGEGAVELGSIQRPFHGHIVPAGEIIFNVGRVRFNAGMLEGEAAKCESRGTFVWQGGRIAVGLLHPNFFANRGRLEIDADASQLRDWDGFATNLGQIEQRGDVQISGVVYNNGTWLVTRPAAIGAGRDAALLLNNDTMRVELDQPGTVRIDVRFDMIPFVYSQAAVRVGRIGEANPPTLAQLTRVNAVRNANLESGSWRVGRGATLDFPNANVESIGWGAAVELVEGDFPSLHLKRNGGIFILKDKVYETGDLENTDAPVSSTRLLRAHPHLLVEGRSELKVNGSLRNSGRLTCRAGATISIAADLINEKTGYLTHEGDIAVGGSITMNGVLISRNGRFIMSKNTILAFANTQTVVDNFDPDSSGPNAGQASAALRQSTTASRSRLSIAASPRSGFRARPMAPGPVAGGSLTVVGSAAFADSVTLVMGVSGPGRSDYSTLSVRDNLALGGVLTINLNAGFQPAASDRFNIIEAGAVTGRFANASNGQRIATIDGYGSFVVSYTGTNVVLSAFQPNANPLPTLPGNLVSPLFFLDGTDVTLTGSPGREYILQTSTNLTDWSSLMTNSASSDGRLTFEVPANLDPYRFFRARAW